MAKPFIYVLFVFLAQPACAEIYKCTKDGKVTYQGSPCDPGSQTEKRDAVAGGSEMAGCFYFEKPRNSPHIVERIKIETASADEYSGVFMYAKGAFGADIADDMDQVAEQVKIKFRRATSKELDLATEVTGIPQLAGIVLADRFASLHAYMYQGIYRSSSGYLANFEAMEGVSGLVEKRPCSK